MYRITKTCIRKTYFIRPVLDQGGWANHQDAFYSWAPCWTLSTQRATPVVKRITLTSYNQSEHASDIPKTAKIEFNKYLFYKCPYQGDHLQGLSEACNIEIFQYQTAEKCYMTKWMRRWQDCLHFGKSKSIESQLRLINSIPS